MTEEKERRADRDKNLKEVCRVMGPVEAEVTKSFLESNGIICLLRGEMVQSLYPLSVDGMGEIRILVLESDYALAKELLKNKPQTGEE
jgi:hypothetical protein